MTENLKPCPFCGEAAETDHYRGVISIGAHSHLQNECAIYCTSCRADMAALHDDNTGRTVEEIMAALTEDWNRRVAPAVTWGPKWSIS
jgi:Lar family restriction alleviation protein